MFRYLLIFLSLTTWAQSPFVKKSVQIDTASDSLKVHLLSDLCYEYRFVSQDSAILFGQQALELAEELDYQGGVAQACNDLGIIYADPAESDAALSLYNRALSIRKLQNDTMRMAAIYNKIGIVYQVLGKLDSAITYQFRSLDLYEAKQYDFGISYALNNIAIIFSNRGDFENSVNYHLRALSIRKQLNDTRGMAASTVNLGNNLKSLGKLDSAIIMYESAIPLLEDLQAQNHLAATYNNLASLYLDQNNLAEAEENLVKSLDIRKQINDVKGMISSLQILANLQLENKQFTAAKKTLDEGYQLATANHLYSSIANITLAYIDWARATGQFEKGFEMALSHIQYKDSVTNENTQKTISELQTKYETEKKEQQIALQQAEIAEQKAVNTQNIVIIIALLLAVIALTVILLLARSRSRKKQALIRQELEIALKEAQIEAAISSQEKERSRFAKDLHDGFGQMISILNLNLKSLKEDYSNRDEVYEQSASVLDEMYAELKGICFNLMPQSLIQNGVVSAVNEFAARVNLTGKIAVETDFFGLEKRLSDVQEISFYRITQEWVNNILKYSDADKVTIQITRDENEITLMIEDNGAGFDLDSLKSGKGNGWRNMNSRANLIKGELEVDTHLGMRGSTLIVNAPVVKEKLKAEEPAYS